MDDVHLLVGLSYDPYKEIIIGYEDSGHLGKSEGEANHALVCMVRGIRKKWKQVVAYYFTKNTISADNLKQLIVHIIAQLQEGRFDVVGTVYDQDPTKKSVVMQLCEDDVKKRGKKKISVYHMYS